MEGSTLFLQQKIQIVTRSLSKVTRLSLSFNRKRMNCRLRLGYNIDTPKEKKNKGCFLPTLQGTPNIFVKF